MNRGGLGAQPVRRKPCPAVLCHAATNRRPEPPPRRLTYKSHAEDDDVARCDTKSDRKKTPKPNATRARTVHDESLRCFSRCCHLWLPVPSLGRRSRFNKSESWLFDLRSNAVGTDSSSSVAAEPSGPSTFNGTTSTLPLPLPLPFAGGCTLKSNMPVAWKDAAAAVAAEAFGTGRVRSAVRFSCRRRSTNLDRKSLPTDHCRYVCSPATALAEDARPKSGSVECAGARIKVRDRGESATPGESGQKVQQGHTDQSIVGPSLPGKELGGNSKTDDSGIVLSCA